MANNRMSTASWGYITGDVSSFAYRPLFSAEDIVYRKSEVNGLTHKQRPYKVLRICLDTNTSGVPLKQDGTTTITGAVAAQADAPWLYDIQELKRLTSTTFETNATASGPVIQGVREDDLAALADIKTYIQTEVGDWADPSES